MSINSDDASTVTGGVLLPLQLPDDIPSRPDSETVRASDPGQERRNQDRHTLSGSPFPSQGSGTHKSLKQSYLDTVGESLVPVSVYNAKFRIYVPEKCDHFGPPTCDGLYDAARECVSFFDAEGALQIKSTNGAKFFGVPSQRSGKPSETAFSPTVIVGDVDAKDIVHMNETGRMESCTGKWGAVTNRSPSASQLSRKET